MNNYLNLDSKKTRRR